MTDKENLKDTLAWMQRKLAAADRSLTNAQYNGDYPAADNLRKNMRRWRTAIMAVKEKIKPVRIDRDKWGRCSFCVNAKSIYGQAQHISTYGVETYYSGEFIFCPECGRPLTEEGWKLLEERLHETRGNSQCTQE